MPRKRDVLEALKRDELVDAVDWFDVPVRDRRVRDDLIDALAASRKAGLAGILEGLSRNRLKEICRALDLDDSGREKAVIIARLAGRDGHASATMPAAVSTPRSIPAAPEPPREPDASREPAGSRYHAGRPPADSKRRPSRGSEEGMEQAQLNWIANFIWGIADDVLRDLYVRGKYRDVILPMTVLRRLDSLLEGTQQDVLDMKARLDKAGIVHQDGPLRQAAGQAFYNVSGFTLQDLKSRASQQQLRQDFEAWLNGFSPNVQ
ncbi:MAG TPA: type I restriction-modification system subunit M N-terminal domain-containing protein, partial [Thermoanaerobaculia bacterium]|nr:type I restriction-modification system subunit M N-terminal domain-containing protein [Thermoanaerobaculia bacterium]